MGVGYLEVFGDGGLPVVLHLSELGPQALHLVLHLHDVLEVPLSPQVQHLNGLGHVLHLLGEIRRDTLMHRLISCGLTPSHHEGWHRRFQLCHLEDLNKN